MKRWMVPLLCVAWIFLFSACDADPDVILQNTVSADEGDSLTDEAAGTLDVSSAGETAASEGVTSAEAAQDAAESASADEQESLSVIFVYICGAVNSPGVYELENGARIYELVELAGGLTDDASAQSVNLAQTVADGDMVYVPTEEESASETIVSDGAVSAADQADAGAGKVNINTATAAELTALSGIGDAKAAAIIAYREEHGSFGSTEEIMQVDGIAEATYNKIKDEITV